MPLVVPPCVNHFWVPRNWISSPLDTRLVHTMGFFNGWRHLPVLSIDGSTRLCIPCASSASFIADPVPTLSWAPSMADIIYFSHSIGGSTRPSIPSAPTTSFLTYLDLQVCFLCTQNPSWPSKQRCTICKIRHGTTWHLSPSQYWTVRLCAVCSILLNTNASSWQPPPIP